MAAIYVTTGYLNSLVSMLADFSDHGIGFGFGHIDGSHIPEQRDALADLFLRSERSHLLFIDSDMTFRASLARDFLNMDKPLIGSIYPRRELDFAALGRAVKETHDLDIALARTIQFNVVVGPEISGERDYCFVEGIGMGFCLISRQCLLDIERTASLKRYKNPFVKRDVSGFFEETVFEDGQKRSEDYSFCRRWRNTGGKIWGDTTNRVSHIGEFAFTGSFLDRLKAMSGYTP